jgi:hypothetical protein
VGPPRGRSFLGGLFAPPPRLAPAATDGDGEDDEEDEGPKKTRPTEKDDDDEFRTDLLMKAVGQEDGPIDFYGWVQGSFTGNPAVGYRGQNFGIEPNSLANTPVLQQLYFVIQRRLEETDRVNFGFRFDNLYGNDWQIFHMQGLFDNAFKPDQPGYDPVQFYGSVHLPWPTTEGIDIKAGRFYALPGYEDGIAPARPLLSAGYLFSFAHPFTHVGVMSSWHVTPNFTLYNGIVNGWDRWFNEHDKWGYAGALTWDSRDERTNFTLTWNLGPDQFPPYAWQRPPTDVPPPKVLPPFVPGAPKMSSNTTLITGILSHEFTDQFTGIAEVDGAIEDNVPGLGPGGRPANSTWYGASGWGLYDLTEKLTLVGRADVFRDNNGTRTGYVNTYFETTFGAIWRPRDWLWFRPEIRGDWATEQPVYNDLKSKSQLTLGFDVIFIF